MILMDVTPLSLSIETVGGIATRLIARNTTIPARHSQIFTTAANFQTSVDIKVYQGERQFVRDNTLLGNFRLSGIKRALAGVPQIEVTFDIDVNGILTVAAKDMGTGKAQQITITSRSNLSEDEIQRAVYEAEMYEKEDGVRKSWFELHSESEVLIAKTEQALKTYGKSMDRQEKHQIKTALNQLKKSVVKYKPAKMTEDDALQLRGDKESLENMAAHLLNMSDGEGGNYK
jgi:molecular chaperone DnaK